LWKGGPPYVALSFRKRARGALHRLGVALKAVIPLCSNVHSCSSVVVAAVRTQGSIINGVLGSKIVEVMVDSFVS